MIHRHINTDEWTVEAIDSVLERGDLQDWRLLFKEARNDKHIAASILESAERHAGMTGASLAAYLVNPSNGAKQSR